MSTAQFTCPLIVVIPGQLIASSLWNSEFVNLFTNINPLGVGAYSDTDAQMQTTTDPFPSGTSRPTSMGGEFERIRFQFVEVIGGTYWYNRPADTIFNLDARITAAVARFPVQTVDIGDAQVTTGKLALLAVTNAQIAANTINSGNLGSQAVNNAALGLLAVHDANVNDVAAGKITGTIVNSQIGAAQVGASNLDSTVPAAVGLKSIQTKTVSATITSGQASITVNTTISSVNTAKAIPVVVGFVPGSLSDPTSNAGFIATLTSATNLRVVVNIQTLATGNDPFSVTVTIIEFN